MQRHAQRRADDLVGQRIVEGHGPGHVGLAAIAAAGGEAADAAEGVSQRQAGSKHIAGAQHRHIVAAHVPDAHDQRQHESAGPHASRLQGREAEDLCRVLAVVAEVDQDHQHLGADNAGQNGDDAEVPELVGIEALLAAELDDEQQAKDQAQGGHQPVGRKAETAKVK